MNMKRLKCILLGTIIGAAIGLAFALITPAHGVRGYIVQIGIGAVIGVVVGFVISLRK
jgi:gas vesicle protein